ncbi:hypothetical protein DM01DRAFT_1054962 [Hesseltinella vesiculosa]|uniref:F-box domain-containing protein n=1 Tax=Hesseltinella vesiculosa TaxID=101127 RepID=A0A1X2GFM8_9FUNG|nr:hypothetical protein DM01DRAFT_1054962 [Hesseltinella vesiculosa]
MPSLSFFSFCFCLMSIPLEIVTDILLELQPYQLLIAATVSRAWSELSLACLYRRVHLHTTIHQKRFLAALESLPLTNREAIRALNLNAGDDVDLEFALVIFGAQCPNLEEISFASSDDGTEPSSRIAAWCHGAPTFPVDLPLFPFIRCIGCILDGKALDRYRPSFHQLTMLALTAKQLLCQVNSNGDAQSPTALFPAMQTLAVIGDPWTSSLDASDFAWLQHHCPRLHHLSLRDLRLANPHFSASVPVQLSMEFLDLNGIELEDAGWFPLFASMYPALESLLLFIQFGEQAQPLDGVDIAVHRAELARQRFDEMTQEISDWIIGCKYLTTLYIKRLGTASTMSDILEKLMDLVCLGIWNSKLKRFALSGKPTHRCKSADRFFERTGSALVSSLDSLTLNVLYFHDRHRRYPRINNTDYSCTQSPMFPSCNLAPCALANLTSMHLQQGYGKIKTSLNWVLQLCPSLRSVGFRRMTIQTDTCHHHHQHPFVATSNHPLTELTFDGCMVIDTDAFFPFLHELPRLTSLTLNRVGFLELKSEPCLDLGHLLLDRLWLAGISIGIYRCSSMRLLERCSSTQRTLSATQPDSYNTGYCLRVSCGLVEQVYFNQSAPLLL